MTLTVNGNKAFICDNCGKTKFHKCPHKKPEYRTDLKNVCQTCCLKCTWGKSQ